MIGRSDDQNMKCARWSVQVCERSVSTFATIGRVVEHASLAMECYVSEDLAAAQPASALFRVDLLII
jgi:hypothetical protein